MDEPLADLSALGFLALCRLARAARDRRAVRAGRGRALRRLPAPSRRAARAAGTACPAPSARRCSRSPRRGARAPAAPASPKVAARGRPSRAARAKRIADDAELAVLLGGRCRAGRRVARIARDRHGPGTSDAARGSACDRRAAGARGRHAPLLRPRLDGALARGARAVPRPRVRRAAPRRSRRTSSCTDATTKHVLREAARGLVPDRIIDKPKIGFFNASAAPGSRGDRARAARHLAAERPALRRMSIDRGAVERLLGTQRRRSDAASGRSCCWRCPARDVARDIPSHRASAGARSGARPLA